MVTTQSNKFKSIDQQQHLKNKVKNIRDIENILSEIETYFLDLESNTDFEFSKGDLKPEFWIRKEVRDCID